MMGLGAMRRLYELGVLRRASTISSVSGGSILNGVLPFYYFNLSHFLFILFIAVLAINWVELMATEGVDLELFDRLIASPVRYICQTNILKQI